jgi:hypothetical protein
MALIVLRSCSPSCHFSNKLFRQLVAEMKETYRNTEDKESKTDFSLTIVQHICQNGGRFVKNDIAVGMYFLLSKTEARAKVSQALRENRGGKRSGASEDSDSDDGSQGSSDEVNRDEWRCCEALVSLSRPRS